MNEKYAYNANVSQSAAYLGAAGGGSLAEADRPIARAMSELAVAQGELETAARALVARVAMLIPGGSPFDNADRQKELPPTSGSNVPTAVASHFCGELNGRIWGLRQITARLEEAARSVEL